MPQSGVNRLINSTMVTEKKMTRGKAFIREIGEDFSPTSIANRKDNLKMGSKRNRA